MGKRNQVVIDDLAYCNKKALDRAEAAEVELITLRKLLSLWGIEYEKQLQTQVVS